MERTSANGRREVVEVVEDLLRHPPSWLREQARACREAGNPERLVRPLCTAVATEALGNPRRGAEAEPAVREWLEGRV